MLVIAGSERWLPTFVFIAVVRRPMASSPTGESREWQSSPHQIMHRDRTGTLSSWARSVDDSWSLVSKVITPGICRGISSESWLIPERVIIPLRRKRS